MGFLERAIRRGVSEGVGRAVGNAIGKAIEPTATNFANQAASAIDQSMKHTEQQSNRTSGLEGAMANLERSMQGYATEAAKNMKICPGCNKPTSADKKFCPDCGTQLPEQTVAQGAVCVSCGKQNSIGTKFCQDCGAKLPAAIQEEKTVQARNESVMAEWENKMSAYPKWNCGGSNYNIECYDVNSFVFSADFAGNDYEARQAVDQYRRTLVQNGFHQAGQYPSIEHLYKRIDGIVCHVDTEHCFEGDSDCPSIGFDVREPLGGYDYVKPEPKKQASLKDLFKF